MSLKKLSLILSLTSLVFAETPNELLRLQLQSINLEAGKKVIDIGEAKKVEEKKKEAKVSKEIFIKKPIEQYLKPYSEYLSELSSEELNKLIKENLEFYAIYKANEINLKLLSYETNKNLSTYINTIAKAEKVYTSNPKNGAKFVAYKETNKKNVNNTKKQNQMVKATEETIEVEGYCVVPQTIKVFTKPFYARVLCNFEKLGETMVFGKLVPDLKNYALYFQPEYAKDLEGNRYKVVKAVMVLNGQQSSPNVATSVDRRLLEKVLTEAGVNTASDVKDAIKNQYLQPQEQNIYVQGDLVVQNKEYSAIDIKEFAIKDFLANLLEAGTKVLKQETKNIPTIFTIEKGALIYTDLVLKRIK